MSSSSAVPQMEAPSPQLIWDTMNAYQRTAALRAAINLDVFTAISDGANTAETLANHCEASLRGMRILCDYLTVCGFLLKNDGVYSLTTTSATFLNRHSAMAMNSMVRYLNSPKLMAGFDNLTDTVKKGKTLLDHDGCNETEYSGWVTFAESMMPLMTAAAEFITEEVLRECPGPSLRVLDIAAGHGLFGITLARRFPHAEIVALDWANVLPIASNNARVAGLSARYRELPGSVFEVDLRSTYDVVLLTNFLHHFDQDTCIGLLKKIHASLVPGGRLMTLEFVPNDDRVTPPIPASFSMMMLGLTPGGDAYTAGEHEHMLREAGFSSVKFVPVPQSPQSLIISQN